MKGKWVVALLFAAFPLAGISQTEKLVVGQQINEQLWKTLPGISGKKLIILDFWNTWCGTCISAFPKIAVLQQQFDAEIQIVLVTTDSRQKVNTLVAKPGMAGKLAGLPSLTDDTAWVKVFPHRSVPHHVWIDRAGIVRSIHSGGQTNAVNISAFLKDNSIKLKQKNELSDFDFKRPLFSDVNLPAAQIQHYSLLLKGEVGVRGFGERIKDSLVYGRYYANMSLGFIFRSLANHLVKGLDVAPERYIIDVKDSLKLDYMKGMQDFDSWETDNLYTYECSVPLEQFALLDRYILEDLNRYTGFNGRVEKRKIKCLVLKKIHGQDKLFSALLAKGAAGKTVITRQGITVNNISLYGLSRVFNYRVNRKLPVFDETEELRKIDLTINEGIESLESVRKELQKYGLDLIEVEREKEFFVLTEKNLLDKTK